MNEGDRRQCPRGRRAGEPVSARCRWGQWRPESVREREVHAPTVSRTAAIGQCIPNGPRGYAGCLLPLLLVLTSQGEVLPGKRPVLISTTAPLLLPLYTSRLRPPPRPPRATPFPTSLVALRHYQVLFVSIYIVSCLLRFKFQEPRPSLSAFSAVDSRRSLPVYQSMPEPKCCG